MPMTYPHSWRMIAGFATTVIQGCPPATMLLSTSIFLVQREPVFLSTNEADYMPLLLPEVRATPLDERRILDAHVSRRTHIHTLCMCIQGIAPTE